MRLASLTFLSGLIFLIAKPSAFLSVFSVVLATMHTKLLTACTCILHSHAKRDLKDIFLLSHCWTVLKDNHEIFMSTCKLIVDHVCSQGSLFSSVFNQYLNSFYLTGILNQCYFSGILSSISFEILKMKTESFSGCV